MKKIIISLAFLVSCCPFTSSAQSLFDEVINKSIRDGFVVLTQEYQMLNEDGEPVSNQLGKNYRGRQHSCGVRTLESSVLLPNSFMCPWKKETSSFKKKYEMIVSTCTLMECSLSEPENIDCDLDNANEVISNHIYSFEISEKPGFEIDNYYGKKKGLAVWVCAANEITDDSNPTELQINVVPMSITTKEDVSVYNLTNQPNGNVIGGAFLTLSTESVGKISVKVNGVFEKFGGVWNMVSLGKDEPDEN